jgi:hypothetical protein
VIASLIDIGPNTLSAIKEILEALITLLFVYMIFRD